MIKFTFNGFNSPGILPEGHLSWDKVIDILASNTPGYNVHQSAKADVRMMSALSGCKVDFESSLKPSYYYTMTLIFKDPQQEMLFRLKYL